MIEFVEWSTSCEISILETELEDVLLDATFANSEIHPSSLLLWVLLFSTLFILLHCLFFGLGKKVYATFFHAQPFLKTLITRSFFPSFKE